MNPLTLIARLLGAPFRFITGLFRSRPLPGESSQSDTPPDRPRRESKDFYLAADDAKTFGNIDYMRTPKSVRKTFTTYGGTQEGVEVVAVASATESAILTPSEPAKPKATSAPSANAASQSPEPPTPISPNRRASSDLDMFRKMAKDIGKKS